MGWGCGSGELKANILPRQVYTAMVFHTTPLEQRGPDATGLGPGPENDEGREQRNLSEPTHIQHLYDKYPAKGFIMITH